MLKRLNIVRYRAIKAQLISVFITSVLMLGLLLGVYWTNETLLSLEMIYAISGGYFLVGLVTAAWVGFYTSSKWRRNIDSLLLMIMELEQGKSLLTMPNHNMEEMTYLSEALFALSKRLNHQVEALQSLVEEKTVRLESEKKMATIEERQRLARDLHDAVSQQLFALAMLSEAAMRQIDKQPTKAKEQLMDIKALAEQAQAEMRALMLHLRPIHLANQDLKTGLLHLINELKEKVKIAFDLDIDPVACLSHPVEEHLFRIIQEGLSNTLRHANCKRVSLTVKESTSFITVKLSDDGQGFNLEEAKAKKTSYGLKTMQERTEEVGGYFKITTSINSGTTIQLRIPCVRNEG